MTLWRYTFAGALIHKPCTLEPIEANSFRGNVIRIGERRVTATCDAWVHFRDRDEAVRFAVRDIEANINIKRREIQALQTAKRKVYMTSLAGICVKCGDLITDDEYMAGIGGRNNQHLNACPVGGKA